MVAGHRFPLRGKISRRFAAALLGTVLLLPPVQPASADITQAEAALAAGDATTAIAFLQPLAAAGDGYAAWKLADIYLAGRGGSPAEGLALLQQAAAAGEPEAQARLGVMYAKGTGVVQDDIEAYKWLSLASRGVAPGQAQFLAETNLTVVGQRLSATERADAEAAALTAAKAYQMPAPESASLVQEPEPVPAVEPTPAIAPETTTQPAAALTAGYRIQLASVLNENDVASEWARLRKRIGAPLNDLQLHVEEVDLGGKGIYHRLQAGPFASRQAATDTCRSVRAGGDDCLVVNP